MAAVEVRPRSVFDADAAAMYQRIHVTLEFLDRLVGGIPKDRALIEAWLRKNMGIKDELELRERTRQTLVELGQAPVDATYLDIVAASQEIASETHTIGFKRTEDGAPYIESRIVKAAIKECVNILFAGERWSAAGKGPKGFTAERVFVKPDRIVVGGERDVHVDMFVGHPTGPRGPMSTVGYYEFVERPTLELEILQLKAQQRRRVDGELGDPRGEPALDYPTWAKTFAHMQLNGLGAMRSQGFGQFAVTRFDVED